MIPNPIEGTPGISLLMILPTPSTELVDAFVRVGPMMKDG